MLCVDLAPLRATSRGEPMFALRADAEALLPVANHVAIDVKRYHAGGRSRQLLSSH